MVFSWSRLAETRIKGHDFKHLDRFEVEFPGNPVNGCGGDVAELVLDDVKEIAFLPPVSGG